MKPRCSGWRTAWVTTTPAEVPKPEVAADMLKPEVTADMPKPEVAADMPKPEVAYRAGKGTD